MNDLRYALRLIRQHPWFSFAIIATIALGIGVNTTVFTLVNAVLFKPLPFSGGDRLVLVAASQPSQGRQFFPVSYPDIADIRQNAAALERVEAFSQSAFVISEQGNPPDRVSGARITPGLFAMLEVQPVLGRTFTEGDAKAGAPVVVLLSHGVWKDRYALDKNVVGRQVRLNETPATIIGVMPDGFKFPNNEAAWTLALPGERAENRAARDFTIVAKRIPGASQAETQAQLEVVAQRLAQQHPASHNDISLRVQTFHQAMNGGPIRLVFLLMLGAVGFVLLIACANVANMLLSRAIGRGREMSIRTALGASRRRVIRQLLTECVVLSMIGSLAGLVFAAGGVTWFANAVSNVGKPYWITFEMDWVVLGYFTAVSVLAGLIFGLAPALQAARVDINESLKDGARGSDGRRGGYLSFALVVFQFALAVVLLCGAGLMVRSFLHAYNEYANIPAAEIQLARVGLPQSRYATPELRRGFHEKLYPRLRALPGVQSVSQTSNPIGGGANGWRVEVPGQTVTTNGQRPAASVLIVGAGYLKTLGMALLRGREFDENDGGEGKEFAVVTQAFASKFFPGEDAIGKRIRFHAANQPKAWMTIIGIAPEFRQFGGPASAPQDPLAFVPYRFEPQSGSFLTIRGQITAAAIRAEVARLDGELPVSNTETLAEFFERSNWHLRVFGTLFSVFAMLALGMAAMGIYAVIAHSIGRRTKEIGVRLALGADRWTILRLVAGRGLLQLGLGVSIGLAGAIFGCRLMGPLLQGVSPNDPLTFGIVITGLLTAGLSACAIPSRKAAALDPLSALRYE
ncbi:MAG: ABC transporter permease [Acidobacteria bacterium]|nr:ABC transporter permease [Acidobacteriota bacterium]